MWVRTQDKKALVNAQAFRITKNIGSKMKAVIYAQLLGESNSLTPPTCGMYQTEEKALDELDRLEKFITENPNGVYQFT